MFYYFHNISFQPGNKPDDTEFLDRRFSFLQKKANSQLDLEFQTNDIVQVSFLANRPHANCSVLVRVARDTCPDDSSQPDSHQYQCLCEQRSSRVQPTPATSA